MPDASAPSMRALERGLAVLRYFTDLDGPTSISAISRETGYDRAVVRRVLGTLETLGYVTRSGEGFILTPSVLELGYAYLSSNPQPRIAEARLRPLADELRESCSFGAMQSGRVVYLACAQVKRISGPTLVVGTVMDPFVTSIGRVLLAAMDHDTREGFLSSMGVEAETQHTITDPSQMRDELRRVEDQGHCVVDQELEPGLLAVAVPVHAASGAVVGAVNITTHTSRTTREELEEALLPRLRDTAAIIDRDFRNIAV